MISLITLPLFKIFIYCSSWIFCIVFDFWKYCIIILILLTEFLGASLNGAHKGSASLTSPLSQPYLISLFLSPTICFPFSEGSQLKYICNHVTFLLKVLQGIPLRLIRQDLNKLSLFPIPAYYFSLFSRVPPPFLIITMANIMSQYRMNKLFLKLSLYYLTLYNEVG